MADPRVPLGTLRTAAYNAVRRGSLRSVAAAIGMSAPGLQHFLNGGIPFPATRRKLLAWYTREAMAAGDYSHEVVQAALAVLTDSLPEEARDEAMREIVAFIRRAYQERRLPPPGWTGTVEEDDGSA